MAKKENIICLECLPGSRKALVAKLNKRHLEFFIKSKKIIHILNHRN